MVLDGQEEAHYENEARKVELKRKFGHIDEMGVYMKGKCPECTNPSLVISSNNRYYCFDCHKGGVL